MELIVLFLLIFSLFNNICITEAGSVKKSFVFGDSLVDTGNFNVSIGGSWIIPNGMTFPGKPDGRFSDGLVLTDYIASFFGLKSPIAFNGRRSAKKSELKHGMNFACGGSGVFDTRDPLSSFPNMTVQIDNFQQMVQEKLYDGNDLHKSVALVTIGANDYTIYAQKNGNNTQGLLAFTIVLIDQLVIGIRRIHDLGVGKIAVTTPYPLGCAPAVTAKFAYKRCDKESNKIVEFHSRKLKEAVGKLNRETKHSSWVKILDLNKAVTSIVKRPAEKLKFNPLKPCCEGITSKDLCGAVADNGTKLYKVCENPKLSLFWDFAHPSQNGWHLIYYLLKSSLYRLYM